MSSDENVTVMDFENLVEFMLFPCGMKVQITWEGDRAPLAGQRDRIFSRVDTVHGYECKFCGEGLDGKLDPA